VDEKSCTIPPEYRAAKLTEAWNATEGVPYRL